MKIILFQHRFAGEVLRGSKRQTIRPVRKRPILPGDLLSLRMWTGLPYRSKQTTLRNERCKSVQTVQIGDRNYPLMVCVDGLELDPVLKLDLAEADGFSSFLEMIAWFQDAHGLPFKGVLIKW